MRTEARAASATPTPAVRRCPARRRVGERLKRLNSSASRFDLGSVVESSLNHSAIQVNAAFASRVDAVGRQRAAVRSWAGSPPAQWLPAHLQAVDLRKRTAVPGTYSDFTGIPALQDPAGEGRADTQMAATATAAQASITAHATCQLISSPPSSAPTK